MVVEFIKCFQELLLGEEKFSLTSSHLLEALSLGGNGFKTTSDILCILLPTIIHDDISKNCMVSFANLLGKLRNSIKLFSQELGVPLSSIPINYQTAPELARLCLRSAESDESLEMAEDHWQIGKEQSEVVSFRSLRL